MAKASHSGGTVLATADRQAKDRDRPRSWVIAEAIRSYHAGLQDSAPVPSGATEVAAVAAQVCQALNAAGAEYLVIGGIACILHGYVRATTDVRGYRGARGAQEGHDNA